MAKQQIIELDFWVDKLTNSIENTVSGETFNTVIIPLTQKDNKHLERKVGLLIGNWNHNKKTVRFISS